jgi:hypothetical protein
MISLEEANRWFTQFEASSLPVHIQQIFQGIQDNIRRGDLYQARLELDRARHVGNRSGRERVEILAACAVACDQLGECEEAANLLRDAHRSAYDLHGRAVALFMQGIVLQKIGRLPGYEEPLELWRLSRDTFKKLADTVDPHLKRTAWYQERANQIEAEMNLEATRPVHRMNTSRRGPQGGMQGDSSRSAHPEPDPVPASPPETNGVTDDDVIADGVRAADVGVGDDVVKTRMASFMEQTVVGRPFAKPQVRTAQDDSSSAETQLIGASSFVGQPPAGKPKPAVRSVTMEAFPILDEIPAGNPGPVAVDANRIGNLEIETVLLEDRPHRLVNLRDRGKTINLNPFLSTGERLVVLRVNGDSMNLAGIDSGDYVLLRQIDTADPEDIVAAEIINEDSQATLKRLRFENGGFMLYPESTNPIHQPRAFNHLGKEFRVRGVALAVFKPE